MLIKSAVNNYNKISTLKTTIKTRRGRGKKKKNAKLVILGSNAAGLKQKMECLQSKISKFQPGCIFIQETKLYRKGQTNIPGYVPFEHIRKNSKGGGLLLSIHESFDPVLIFEGDDDIELLVVQGKVSNCTIRFFNAYGPQEDSEKVLDFYEKLEEEIQLAKDDGCCILVEMDANAKLGYEVIKGDPNPQSNNGSLLWSLIQRNNLKVLNASDICKGIITRERTTKVGVEKAVLDYIIVCDNLLKHVDSMVVDEERCDVLTKYASKTGKGKVVASDHNLLTCAFNIVYTPKISDERLEVFNFKNNAGQKLFFKETSGVRLSKCFPPDRSVNVNAHTFNKTLMKIVHKCFKKVRVTKRINPVLEEKLKHRDKIKKESLKSPTCKEKQE